MTYYCRIALPSVAVIEPPAPLLTASEVRDRLNIRDDDKVLSPLIRAVCASIEPPYGWVGRAFMPQTLEQRSEWFADYWGGSEVRLRFPPLVSVTSVKYVDSGGTEQTLAPSSYNVLTAGSRIVLAYGGSWPSVRAGTEAVRIRYVAGHAPDDPWLESAKSAVALGVQELLPLAKRDPGLTAINVPGVGSQNYTYSGATADVIRRCVENLLAGYRVWH